MPRPPPILVLNIIFGELVPKQIYVPNLKLLASRLQKYAGGPKFLNAPLAQPLSILVLNVVFGKPHPVPKWCKNFVAHLHV